MKESMKLPPIITINITKDKNDKDSLYLGDIISAQMGNKEAKENILAFFKMQEDLIQKIKDDIPNKIEFINACLGGKK